jgi:hypothetical protein
VDIEALDWIAEQAEYPRGDECESGRRNAPEPNSINASTPYDFNGRNLTPYGGLLPVMTMLEKLGFESLVKETLAAPSALARGLSTWALS